MEKLEYLKREIEKEFENQGESYTDDMLAAAVDYAVKTYDIHNKSDSEIDEIIDYAVEHIVEYVINN